MLDIEKYAENAADAICERYDEPHYDFVLLKIEAAMKEIVGAYEVKLAESKFAYRVTVDGREIYNGGHLLSAMTEFELMAFGEFNGKKIGFANVTIAGRYCGREIPSSVLLDMMAGVE